MKSKYTQMTKAQAVAIFGKYQADLARALGITPQAVSKWPQELRQADIDQVVGACRRLGKKLPR